MNRKIISILLIGIFSVIPCQSAFAIDNNNYNSRYFMNYEDSTKLQNYLSTNYSGLKTELGTIKFTYNVSENNEKYLPYDLDVEVHYTPLDFNEYDLNEEGKELLDYTLETVQKDYIAKTCIEMYPDKKIRGEYYDSWYEYPNLRVGYESISSFSWNNYEIEYDWDNIESGDYEEVYITDFHWDTENDG